MLMAPSMALCTVRGINIRFDYLRISIDVMIHELNNLCFGIKTKSYRNSYSI
ncbi:hypothetical protein SAMN04488057_107172 [Cyclobacterium lianum]|uniref:Uncharacterized protein n=1 Tax=Cyclobacterium lianum TaxID=388280 RepID=A0A1M7P9Y5_9BACT|nr:hypothetical protein SAMN04488057_107172 [Cyclobacterium lianum]